MSVSKEQLVESLDQQIREAWLAAPKNPFAGISMSYYQQEWAIQTTKLLEHNLPDYWVTAACKLDMIRSLR